MSVSSSSEPNSHPVSFMYNNFFFFLHLSRGSLESEGGTTSSRGIEVDTKNTGSYLLSLQTPRNMSSDISG